MFIPYAKNPGWNLDAVLTLVGVTVWAVCALGEGYGIATMPGYVSQVGSMMFGVGVGRASRAPPHQYKDNPTDP